jgi:hypothetical protein
MLQKHIEREANIICKESSSEACNFHMCISPVPPRVKYIDRNDDKRIE